MLLMPERGKKTLPFEAGCCWASPILCYSLQSCSSVKNRNTTCFVIMIMLIIFSLFYLGIELQREVFGFVFVVCLFVWVFFPLLLLRNFLWIYRVFRFITVSF